MACKCRVIFSSSPEEASDRMSPGFMPYLLQGLRSRVVEMASLSARTQVCVQMS